MHFAWVVVSRAVRAFAAVASAAVGRVDGDTAAVGMLVPAE